MLTDLRALVDYLRRQRKLLVVEREVDPRFELNAVIRKIQAGENLPVLFKHVRGTRFPVLSNALGNYGLVAQLLGVQIGRLAARWAELAMPNAAPVTEEHPSVAPDWHEISLNDLPHIVFCEKDCKALTIHHWPVHLPIGPLGVEPTIRHSPGPRTDRREPGTANGAGVKKDVGGPANG